MLPLVGLLLGVIFYISSIVFSLFPPMISALLVLLLWLGSTGFLHLDGFADLIDGIAASHGDSSRMLEVMKEPHIGSFAVVGLILLILSTLILLYTLITWDVWAELLLIPAWARLGAVWWSELPPLHQGLASWLKPTESSSLTAWFAILLFLSLLFQPILLLAPIVLWAWKLFLETKLGGMNGDALGAGIEISEVALLLLCCISL